jgi:protein TonB
MTEQEEKKNRRVAFLTTMGIHGLLFLLMFFIIAWRPPDPPLGASGIALNFGLDDQGSGEEQPSTPVGSRGKEQDEPEKSEAQPASPQETQEQPVEEEKTKVDKPAEVNTESQVESPVTVKETKKEDVKPVEKPKEKTPEKPVEVVKPKTDQNAVYNPTGQKANSTNKTGDGKQGDPGNEGNDKDKTGDKGDPRGVDKSAIYEGNPGVGTGGPGGAGGFGLQMSGWTWDESPKAPKIPDNESGFVIFEITVDEQGEIVDIKPIEQTLSPEAIRLCRLEIERRSLVRTSTGAIPTRSKGRVVFNLRLK